MAKKKRGGRWCYRTLLAWHHVWLCSRRAWRDQHSRARTQTQTRQAAFTVDARDIPTSHFFFFSAALLLIKYFGIYFFVFLSFFLGGVIRHDVASFLEKRSLLLSRLVIVSNRTNYERTYECVCVCVCDVWHSVNRKCHSLPPFPLQDYVHTRRKEIFDARARTRALHSFIPFTSRRTRLMLDAPVLLIFSFLVLLTIIIITEL